MDAERWVQIIKSAYSDPALLAVLANFLEREQAVLETDSVTPDGQRFYKMRFDRPHVAEVEREGSRHWVVRER